MKGNDRNSVLLFLLPFWTPQIPPLGISCLKSYISQYNYRTKIYDLNIEESIRNNYNEYFNIIKNVVDNEIDGGGFYNIGHDLLQNHMMAFIKKKEPTPYISLIKKIVYNTFYIKVNDDVIIQLDAVLKKIFQFIEEFITVEVEKYRPANIGFSCFKGNLPTTVHACKIVKKKFKGINTIIGGGVFAQGLVPHSPDFEYFLNDTKDYIDRIILGEGEAILLNILEGKFSDNQRVISSELYNLSIEDAPLPDYSDLKIDIYPSLSFYTSRSCPYQCSFCTETVYWGKYRKKEVHKIIEGFESLYVKYNYQLFLLGDSLLNPVINELSEELIKKDSIIYWDGYLRISKDSINPDKTLLWRKGGFYRARLGIESGSERVLNLMNKKINIEDIKSSIINLALVGIKTTTYWIVGYPGETEDDFKMTLDLIGELSDYIYEAHANPFGYYYSGQSGSDSFLEQYTRGTLYPESARDLLVVQTWQLDCYPDREIVYRRLKEFERFCNSLGIVNPYSLYDINKMDDRWSELHKNSVPSLVSLKDKNHIVKDKQDVRPMLRSTTNKSTISEFGF